MIRQLTDRQKSAIDTRTWLASINDPPDEAVTLLLTVLDCAIEDYNRMQNGQPITSQDFQKMCISQAVAGILLEDLLEQHPDELRGFDITMTPTTKPEILFIILNDSLDQLTRGLTKEQYSLI
jgi:hypothetical protein